MWLGSVSACLRPWSSKTYGERSLCVLLCGRARGRPWGCNGIRTVQEQKRAGLVHATLGAFEQVDHADPPEEFLDTGA